MIKKILIANRGEIAVRIIRACREMNIPAVGVYSTIDKKSLHVQMAAETVCIGNPPPLESYLNIDNIIQAARATGADAIHPGYGFLAENHLFAERCEKEGIVFIGPNSRALKLVGDKVASRNTVSKEKIPIIPGMQFTGKDLKDFLKGADAVGYPIIIKASLGGGGKGMRIVRAPKELEEAVAAGMREAKSAFGDASVYLEKYIEEPRHIEFQILADHHGNALHLFERECSIQRRHQKIVEETPSLALDQALRQKMGETAIRVAKTVGYTNAGTVEFLLDRDKNFYFLEVNARIQVEHPVTELVTGIDLVRQQILIASGERLKIDTTTLKQHGHAIECRIYAEDPDNNFIPSPGIVRYLKEPSGPGVRCDSGLSSNIEISPYYDPILAKLITWGENRETARQRMIAALSEYVILGIKSTVSFLKGIMNDKDYIAGNLSTGFIERHFNQLRLATAPAKIPTEIVIAAALTMLNRGHQKKAKGPRDETTSPWLTIGKWEIAR